MKKFTGYFVLMLLVTRPVLAQQNANVPKPESYKYRTIGTITGAAGGFATGLFVGLSAFDDSVNSDRKVWTASVVGAGAGAVGGYFIGRVLDHKRKRTAGLDLRLAPVLTPTSRTVYFALRF